MVSTKEIRQKIRSVTNTQNITRAMEMIAAVKMRKAQHGATQARPYAQAATAILAQLAGMEQLQHPLLQPGRGSKRLAVVIAADRGLCGAYNTNILRTTARYLRDYPGASIITVGSRAASYLARRQVNIVADYSKLPDTLGVFDAYAINAEVLRHWSTGEYAAVDIIYTHYISTISSRVAVAQLLPLTQAGLGAVLGTPAASGPSLEPIIEPSPTEALDTLLPALSRALLLHCMLDGKAAEWSSRMLAMKNAKDNAKAVVTQLKRTYNKVRQAAVTREIAEIVSGIESMKEV